jgi:integrase
MVSLSPSRPERLSEPSRTRNRLPSLRQHGRGHFFWRVKGRDVYAGRDLREAQAKYSAAFPDALPGAGASEAPQTQPEPSKGNGSQPKARAGQASPTVQVAADRLLSIIDADCTPERCRVYRYELAPFLERFGSMPLHRVTPEALLAWRNETVGAYAAWTANGRLSLARRVCGLAFELGMIAAPIKIKLALAGVDVGRTKTKAWTPAQVSALLKRIATVNPNLARMCRLQFLCCLRPFSVPSVIFGRGEWEAPGVFVLAQSKTEKATGEAQRVCFSPEAVAQLKQIEPAYNGGRLYRQAVNKATAATGEAEAPHALRHSGATCLANKGVADELIETALGHLEPRVKRVYRPAKYQATREALSVLAKMVPAVA